MKTIRILSLHLSYGGIEKAIVNMANMFVENYNVEIISVYKISESPAFPLDERVKVRYLLKYTPNRDEWKAAALRHAPISFVKESIKAIRTLICKKNAVIKTIKGINDGVLITTRHEDNLVLSKYGNRRVYKIAQLHHDHNFEEKFTKGFEKDYGNIDVFALLAPKLEAEVKEIMKDNHHTRVVSIPNFLDHFPGEVDISGKDKTVLAVGRLDPVKGFDRLIEMFVRIHEKAPDWKLHIAGDGAEKNFLERLIHDNNAEGYIKLLGKLNGAEVEKQMLSAAIYAMTSKSEGIPFVILEAQSCALPCVAFDVRIGPSALIENGKTGILVPDGDEREFISRMLELMNSTELRKQLGIAARENSLLYSKEKISEKWKRILEGEDA